MQNHTLATLPQTEAGAAANQAAANKIVKYNELASTHIFYPVAIETVGTWKHWAVELDREIGRRATFITGKPRESTFLWQQLSAGRGRQDHRITAEKVEIFSDDTNSQICPDSYRDFLLSALFFADCL